MESQQHRQNAVSAQDRLVMLMRNEFARLQAKNQSYSLRAYAKRLNLVPSATSDILNGKREVSPKMAKKILEALHADPDMTTEIVERLGQALKSEKDTASEFQQIQMDQYHVIADWHYFAILSLAEIDGFKDEPDWIANRLGISKADASRALERLERLVLLERKNGRLCPTGNQFETTHDVASLSLRKSHSQTLELAQNSLANDSVDERDLGAMTMAIDPALLPEAKQMIRKFRRRLSTFLESGKKKEVYRFSTILFPLSKRSL